MWSDLFLTLLSTLILLLLLRLKIEFVDFVCWNFKFKKNVCLVQIHNNQAHFFFAEIIWAESAQLIYSGAWSLNKNSIKNTFWCYIHELCVAFILLFLILWTLCGLHSFVYRRVCILWIYDYNEVYYMLCYSWILLSHGFANPMLFLKSFLMCYSWVLQVLLISRLIRHMVTSY